MTTTILALALLGSASASDHDSAVHAELLSLGLPTDLSPGAPAPELPHGAALPTRVGHASRSRGGSRGSSSSRGGSRSSGSRSRSSGSRSGGTRSSPPSSPKPRSGSRPSTSKPSGSRPSTSKPSGSRPSTSKPSGSRPSTSKPSGSRPPATNGPNSSRRPPAGSTRRSAPNTGARPGARTSPPSRTLPGRTVHRPTPRSATTRPSGTLRNSRTSRPQGRPVHRTSDVRYARPSYRHVTVHRSAHYHAPRVYTYRPYYTRWWSHPYYRYSYATVAVVGFGFNVWAWDAYWVPPYRAGWSWVPGYWAWGYWNPGYWSPTMRGPVGYVYVNGWWEGDAYVEGYYRAEARDDWDWVDGYYLDDGTYVRGHWSPATEPPEGYLWEPGFWDGETYIDGFYRPQFRKAFYWVGAWYDAEGIFHSGYWQPEAQQQGSVWVPGWFDGNEWVPGYWEDEQTFLDADLESWAPEEGFDAGWEEGQILDDNGDIYAGGEGDQAPTARLVKKLTDLDGAAPLAVPIVIPDDAE